ncbi:MAG TPA: efflux RND transporter periplasmic adaptor subunit [Candidatus Binataceae bacterium]|nr:efflux RND transporter periplasmic adaptor subunit [Candidatus Binataceae bacterium]
MSRLVIIPLCLTLMLMAIACEKPAAQRSRATSTAPSVSVVHPSRGTVSRTITLPGDLAGFYQSALYSKVTGYLKSIYVDKGDAVKAGQVLAVIEVPELDQQLTRARTNLEVQRITYERLEGVWKSDPRLVARQDVDIAKGKFDEARANVDELMAMDSYRRIIAPFDGVITERFVDPGALIHAGGQQSVAAPMQGAARPGGSAAPVVSVARLDKLRVYVYVPQGQVSAIRAGMPATIEVQGLHGKRFEGTVVRFAHSLDLATRTMLTEVDLDNPKNELFPGMYAQVTLMLEDHADALRVPASALGGADRNKVLVVKDGRIAEVPVGVGIVDDHYAEITSGLTNTALVVAAFNNNWSDGEPVKYDLAEKGMPAFVATAE